MPTSELLISDAIFRETMIRSVQAVVKTMLGLDAVFLSEHEARRTTTRSIRIDGEQVVGTAGFVGDINGLIYLYVGAELAQFATTHLLDIGRAELEASGDEGVNDTIGELTNMTVGTFKNELCDRGFNCKLTIPSLLRGTNFTIEPVSTATRRIYYFKVGAHRIVADLLMKRAA